MKDFSMRDRTASTLGLPLKLEEPVVERAKMSLIQPKEYDWRNFCEGRMLTALRLATSCSSSPPTPCAGESSPRWRTLSGISFTMESVL